MVNFGRCGNFASIQKEYFDASQTTGSIKTMPVLQGLPPSLSMPVSYRGTVGVSPKGKALLLGQLT